MRDIFLCSPQTFFSSSSSQPAVDHSITQAGENSHTPLNSNQRTQGSGLMLAGKNQALIQQRRLVELVRHGDSTPKGACEEAIQRKLNALSTGTHLVQNIVTIPVSEYLYFPNPTAETHTMAGSLKKYAEQKLPIKELEEALSRGTKISVIQCLPAVFENNVGLFGFENIEKISDHQKRFNSARHTFYNATTKDGVPKFVAAVMPGKDYHRHYAANIRYAIKSRGYNEDESMEVTCCEQLRSGLVDFHGLDKRFVKPGDTVILAYQHQISGEMMKHLDLLHTSSFINEAYGSERYTRKNGEILNFLDTKDSNWGDLPAEIARRALELGATEIMYFAKLGCLTKPEDILQKKFSPTRYVDFEHDKMISSIEDVRNGLVEVFPELDSGVHASVSTVLEEDYSQRGELEKNGVNSIDIEMQRIASVISQFNKEHKKQIPFTPLLFASDYLRSKEEAAIETPHDLSNNQTLSAKQKKQAVVGDMAAIFAQYLENRQLK